MYRHLEQDIFVFLVGFRLYLLGELDNGLKVNIGLLFLNKTSSFLETEIRSRHTLGARASVFSIVVCARY